MAYIIYPQLPSNKLTILSPVGETSIEEVAKKDVPSNTPYTIVDTLNGIDDDYFDAYIYSNGVLDVDIIKAKDIHLNKFRQARKPILEKLDVEYMRALEAGNTQKQQEIAAKKQALRDVTNTTLPNDLEGIKNTWPDVLNS